MPVQGAWTRPCRGVSVSLSSEVGVGELTARIAGLAVGEALTIAEFQASEVARWQVRIDGRGTPRATCESIGLAALRRDGVLSESELDRFLAPRDLRHLLIAGGEAAAESPEAGYAWELARRRYIGAPLLEGGAASVDEQLCEAIARVPLAQRYELCLLERDRSGRLHVSPQRLFERGARRGDTRTLRVYCEPSGPAGTTFAVMARDGAGHTGLAYMASAKVSLGPHTVTATLQRPGKVSFGGLGVPLRPDTRKWADIRAAVPERLGSSGPVNLILAVEICGPERLVAAHLDRAAQLAGNVASSAECPVSFSLLAYGAHPHNLRVDDDPVAVLAWTEPYHSVLAQLSGLRRQAIDQPDHYTRAANIECMLGQAAGLLSYGQGSAGNQPSAARPVLVTVGSRGPFPAWRDPVTEILPCPGHNDWRGFLQRLQDDHPRMTFGAICGGDRDAEAWRLLGADATADLIVLDAWQFATDLRLLRPPGEHVPFPLVDR
jgi:hypothetical protein